MRCEHATKAGIFLILWEDFFKTETLFLEKGDHTAYSHIEV